MHYHIILTEICNSHCKYCFEKSLNEFNNKLDKKFSFDFSAPSVSNIKINDLKEFLKKDLNPILIFYGGEPLLEIEKIKEIIDNIDIPFRMQTNAKLINKLPIEYLKKIQKILVSIDGDKQRTDYNRGFGTYELVVNNLKTIKNQGYCGEIIARMTLSGFPDLFSQVIHLIDLKIFDSIHWQLDAGFYENDFNKEKFSLFVKEYNLEVTKLIDFWIKEMEKGRVIRLYPFIGIINSLLNNKTTRLRCGAGYKNYTITTDGKITACPIMNNIVDFYAGDLKSNPEKLKKFSISGSCNNCEVRDICGGRCLYWNKTNLWPKEGDNLICNTIKHLINELKKSEPKIRELIHRSIISKKDFNYEEYFGPEIIP